MEKKSDEQTHIENLSFKRDEYLKFREDSYDETIGEFGEYTIDPPEIDNLTDQILDCIKKWRNSLTFEFIIEELTKLGWGPCLIYDDNGNFAITGTGMQSISEEDPDDCELIHIIEKKDWKPTIREALNYYLDNE